MAASASDKIKKVLSDLGPIGIGVYLALTALVYALSMALGSEGLQRLGIELPAGASTASVIGIGYVASKVTQPLRIAGALLLTPLVARVMRKKAPAAGSPESPSAPDEQKK